MRSRHGRSPEGLRKVGVIIAAILSAFALLVLITIPLAFAMWVLLNYAAGR